MAYQIPFINAAIRAFAQRFAMTRQAAYAYLKRYAGMAFLYEYYDVVHLQSLDDTVDDLIQACTNHGGPLR